jgi:hypothetical protein
MTQYVFDLLAAYRNFISFKSEWARGRVRLFGNDAGARHAD